VHNKAPLAVCLVCGKACICFQLSLQECDAATPQLLWHYSHAVPAWHRMLDALQTPRYALHAAHCFLLMAALGYPSKKSAGATK